MNTLQKGMYRWMVFRDGNSWVGVALEFNIVVTGDDPKVVEFELQEAVLGYLESVKKVKGFRTGQVNAVLNQKPEEEYESRWIRAIEARQKNTGVLSPLSDVYKAGIANLVSR